MLARCRRRRGQPFARRLEQRGVRVDAAVGEASRPGLPQAEPEAAVAAAHVQDAEL